MARTALVVMPSKLLMVIGRERTFSSTHVHTGQHVRTLGVLEGTPGQCAEFAVSDMAVLLQDVLVCFVMFAIYARMISDDLSSMSPNSLAL